MTMTMPTLEPAARTRAVAGLVPSTRFFVCAECRHAQLFAVQPRAVCTRGGAPFEGQVLFAGQPGCASVAPRHGADIMLAWTAPGAKVTTRRFRRGVSRTT
jgi:hypothetical protein